MVKEFREFLFKQNALALAIGVIIGRGKVVVPSRVCRAQAYSTLYIIGQVLDC
jgi:Large-conductance mechanosensitive channel, MscL